jgi:hypothetical protein
METKSGFVENNPDFHKNKPKTGTSDPENPIR